MKRLFILCVVLLSAGCSSDIQVVPNAPPPSTSSEPTLEQLKAEFRELATRENTDPAQGPISDDVRAKMNAITEKMMEEEKWSP